MIGVVGWIGEDFNGAEDTVVAGFDDNIPCSHPLNGLGKPFSTGLFDVGNWCIGEDMKFWSELVDEIKVFGFDFFGLRVFDTEDFGNYFCERNDIEDLFVDSPTGFGMMGGELGDAIENTDGDESVAVGTATLVFCCFLRSKSELAIGAAVSMVFAFLRVELDRADKSVISGFYGLFKLGI